MSRLIRKHRSYPKYFDGKKFKVLKFIDSGSFGRVFLGKNLESNQLVAIKMESNKLKRSQLLTENKIYRILKESTGVPNMYYYGNQGNYRAIVLDLMGPSLKSLHRTCKGHFSLKTILMLFNQMLDRVEDLHSKSYVHRDLKPANFVIGVGNQSQTLHLVDFGLAQLYRNPATNEHVPNERKEFAGTLVYASINSVKNLAQSRCDDLESIGYLLIHFHRGKLPWYDLAACGPMQKFERITELKLSIPIEKLCAGLPDEFNYYIWYCRSLNFDEEPNYNFLRTMFSILFHKKLKYTLDYDYDWKKQGEPELFYKNLVTRLSTSSMKRNKLQQKKLKGVNMEVKGVNM